MIERRLALAAFVVSVQRNRFCTMGAFSWQNSPVKILFARKVQDGGAKRPHSGTLQREQNSPNSGTLLSASQTFPLTGESPRPTQILYFVRSKNTPTTPNFSLRFCTRICVPNGIACKFPLATGGVSLYNKRQIIFADGRTARFLRCKESYNRCWVNMSECG